MDDTERGELITEYVKRIILGIDLLMVDTDNIALIKKSIEYTAKQVTLGYAFPMLNYAKIDRLNAENKVLQAIYDLIRAREHFLKMVAKAKESTLDEAVLSALGIA